MNINYTIKNPNITTLIAALIFLLFTIAFINTAWIAEDAFITFRVIENTLNGFGPNWNPNERVQVFTHTLWFWLLTFAVSIISDPYYSALITSYTLFALIIITLLKTSQKSNEITLIPITALLWSKSFIDYSSSGLENPMTHALLGIFLILWSKPFTKNKTLHLTLIFSALYLTRPDAIILILPAMALYLWENRNLKPIILGASPILLWSLFSIFYYGSPVPNTALAKVSTGKTILENSVQAWSYINWTLTTDSITALIITGGFISALIKKEFLPLAVGFGLWCAYLFYIGADYMGGRFFSAAALFGCLIMVLAPSKALISTLAIALLINLSMLSQSIFSSINFENKKITEAGIADERGFYYSKTGLLPSLQSGTWFTHQWLTQGHYLQGQTGWYTRCSIGMIPFAAGPSVQWIDPLALSEPFLARLPARKEVRVGHYERAFPDGYLESILTNKNLIADPKLRALYSDVNLATRGPLFSMERMAAIFRLNTGHHADAADSFDREAIGLPNVPVQTRKPASCFGIPTSKGEITWKLTSTPLQAIPVITPLP